MPKCFLNLLYTQRNSEPLLHRDMKCDHRWCGPDVMTTRSGLSIKKVHTKQNQREPTPVSNLSTCTSNIPSFQSQKGVIKSESSISIITRYEMLCDGVEVDSVNLDITNNPSVFLATESEIGESILSAGDLTYDSYMLLNTPTLASKSKSVSMPNLSTASTISSPNHTPLLERSLSYSSPSTSTSPWMANQTDEMRQILEDHPLIDVDKESNEELYKKLSQFTIPLSGPSIFKCKVCRRIYGSIREFGEHMNSHLRLKNKCHICGCLFSRTFLLKGHLRTHTGEKPFECESCGKKFADRSNWRCHIHTHSNTRKIHACPHCGKSFAQKRYLRKHIMEVCK